MGKMSLEWGLCTLMGVVFGSSIGKRRYDRLELERDCLQARNELLEAHNEGLSITCDNLKAANEQFANLLTQEKEEKS